MMAFYFVCHEIKYDNNFFGVNENDINNDIDKENWETKRNNNRYNM